MEASALAGRDSSLTKPEALLVDEIVKDVLKKLKYDSLPSMDGLVGIDLCINQIETLLNTDECSDVCSVGIWGMGGIGKTTIDEVVFNQISTQFETHCFLENVKDASRGKLLTLRETLLSRLLDESIYLETPRMQCTYIKSRLRGRRVLIVLDDVSDSSRFEILVGVLDAFGPGSRIIVTSRDRQLLINCRVVEDKIYQVMELKHPDALELFSRHAFKRNHPPPDFLILSGAMVNYAKGLPLALKVLGSALQQKPPRYWKDFSNKIKQVPHPKIGDVLRTSFDRLDSQQKSIFLDIACFFNGDVMDDMVEILASSYHSIYAGVDDLIDKSLITLSDNRIRMHDLLQEMGWEVVRNASKLSNSSISEPGQQSRLWTPEDAHDVLTKNSGTEHIEGIFLDTSKVEKIQLSHTVFSRMPNLRLLKFFSYSIKKELKLHLPQQGLESLPSELRYLYWEGYPLRSLPSNFNPKKLVEFSMPRSNLEELWVEPMYLVKLKKINLRYSKISGIVKILSGARWLRELDLSGTPIQEIPISIGCLHNLVRLLLNDCTLLNNHPSSVRMLDSLEYLSLARCTSFSEFPELPENIKDLLLEVTAIVEVPPSVGHLSKLESLNMRECKSLKRLSSSICKMKSLISLKLSSCSSLENFPEILEKMESLEDLNLSETAIKCLPSSIGNLTKLRYLNLQGTAIEELPSSIENAVKLCFVYLNGARNLSKIPDTFQLTVLEGAEFRNYPALTKFVDNSETISFLSALRCLDLTENNFERLRRLYISNWKRLKWLPYLPPHLERLYARGCLESFGNFHCHSGEQYLYRFLDCFNLTQAGSEIIENAHRNIQLIAAGDFERFNHQALWRWVSSSSAYFSLATTEIPRFNDYQSIGSSVVVQVSPCGQNSQLMGFEFCIVVESSKDTMGCWFVEVDCNIKSNQCYSRGFIYSSSWLDWYEDAPITDHLLLFYDTKIYENLFDGHEGYFSGQNSLVEVSFQFRIAGPEHNYTHMIKKCGVHLLYKDTQQPITFNEGQPSRFLSIDEEEDPQSKRFEESRFSDMHRCLEAVTNSRNTQGSNDNYCYSGTDESVANFGNCKANEDHEAKGELRKFSLWDFVVRFL